MHYVVITASRLFAENRLTYDKGHHPDWSLREYRPWMPWFVNRGLTDSLSQLSRSLVGYSEVEVLDSLRSVVRGDGCSIMAWRNFVVGGEENTPMARFIFRSVADAALFEDHLG